MINPYETEMRNLGRIGKGVISFLDYFDLLPIFAYSKQVNTEKIQKSILFEKLNTISFHILHPIHDLIVYGSVAEW